MLVLWISWFLGCVLSYAAIAKTVQFTQFRIQLMAFLPPALTRPVAVSLLSVEYGIAALLLTGYVVTATFYFAVVLFSAFTVFVCSVLLTGSEVSCNCFGEDDSIISQATLARNVILLVMALAGSLLSFNQATAWTSPFSIVVAIDGISGSLLFLAGYQLATLRSRARNFV